MKQIKNCSLSGKEIHLQKQLYLKSSKPDFSWYGSKAFPLSPLEVLSLVYFWIVSPEYVKIASPTQGKGFLPPDPPANLSCHCGPFWYYILVTCGGGNIEKHICVSGKVYCLQGTSWPESPVAVEQITTLQVNTRIGFFQKHCFTDKREAKCRRRNHVRVSL